LGNGVGKVLYKGKLIPTIGSISMDLMMIDLSEIPDAREGDEVIIFGNGLSVSELARWAGTIPYDILSGISQRVKRVYFE
jgi:alanine racemase